MVALVWVAVGTDTVLVVVAAVFAVSLLLGSLVVRSVRSVLASVAAKFVAVTLSVEVGVTAASVLAVLAVADLTTVLTIVSIGSATLTVVGVLALMLATVLGFATVAAISGWLLLRDSTVTSVLLAITTIFGVAGLVSLLGTVASRLMALLVVTTVASATLVTVSITVVRNRVTVLVTVS